jgi:hypothetical protein
MTNNELLQSIAAAFSSAGLPLTVVDDVPGDFERHDIQDAFAGKTWDSISDDVLLHHAEAVFFFTPEAWVYYLPAYMSFMIRDLEGCDFVIHSVVESLVSNMDEYRPLLGTCQRQVIADVLSWMIVQLPDEPRPAGLSRVMADLAL